MAVRMSGLPIKTGHIFIAIALIMALVSAVMIKNIAVNKADKGKEEKTPITEIAVAASPIPAGETITVDHIKMVEWPAKYVNSGSVFTNPSDLVGRTVKSDLVPGEPVFKEKLTGDKSLGGMPAMLPPGMRAITIAVSEVKGVAGFVKPGDYVDVLVVGEIKDREAEEKEEYKISKTVLQNVLVMASAQQMVRDSSSSAVAPPGLAEEPIDSKDKDKKKKKEKSDRDLEKERKERDKQREKSEKKAKTVSSVTLALTPEQVEVLALADEYGDLRLALRPEGDTTIVQTDGSFDSEFLFQAGLKADAMRKSTKADVVPPPMPTMEVPPVPTQGVEFIEGTSKSSVSF